MLFIQRRNIYHCLFDSAHIDLMFQLKDALEKQLSELEKLSETIKRERQIIQDLNEFEPKING